MKRIYEVLMILITLFVVGSCSGGQEIFVAYSDPHIIYEGRIDTTQVQAAVLYWPGSSIKIRFKGGPSGRYWRRAGEIITTT